jgi:putative ABC transport system ATP-binding protein
MALELIEVTKTYEMNHVGVRALRGVSFQLSENEYVAIMGPSGSGKSTLMNIIGCLDVPSSGQYFIDGQDVSTFGEDRLAAVRNSKIGFVFQTFNLLPRADVFHNVELPLIYRGLRPALRREKAMAAIESVGLGDRVKHKPNELSGGQRQRVAIARALVNEPSVILADEPTGNLDSRNGMTVIDLLGQLNRSFQRTVVIATHSDLADSLATRHIRIRDGVITDPSGEG